MLSAGTGEARGRTQPGLGADEAATGWGVAAWRDGTENAPGEKGRGRSVRHGEQESSSLALIVRPTGAKGNYTRDIHGTRDCVW
jgi:hypothetical protein